VRALFGTGDEDTVYLLQFFLASGHSSWDDFVDILLNSTSGLLPTARLGGPLSGAWAAGKVTLTRTLTRTRTLTLTLTLP